MTHGRCERKECRKRGQCNGQREKRSKKDTSNLYTEEEYAAMLERIKRELVEEMMQNAGEIIQETEERPTTE